MSLSVRGRLDVEKVKNSKDMPAEEGRGIGYYDDCLAKLANQEEDERLSETMDSLHLQRTRMLADTRHELKSVDRTLRKLENQKKLLRRATLENVISGTNRQLAFKSFQSITEASESENESEDLPKNESEPSDISTNVSASWSALPGVPIPTDSSLSGYDTYWLRRRGINPPLCSRPASTKIFNETYIDEASTESASNKSKRRFSLQRTSTNLTTNNNSNTSVKKKEKDERSRTNVRPKTSLGRDRQRIHSSNSSRDLRPHTAQAVGTRGRSRRELTQLAHIDAVTSSEREHRRTEWLEAKSILKEKQDKMLRKKVLSFLENIERDKKRFLLDVNGCVNNLDFKIL